MKHVWSIDRLLNNANTLAGTDKNPPTALYSETRKPEFFLIRKNNMLTKVIQVLIMLKF